MGEHVEKYTPLLSSMPSVTLPLTGPADSLFAHNEPYAAVGLLSRLYPTFFHTSYTLHGHTDDPKLLDGSYRVECIVESEKNQNRTATQTFDLLYNANHSIVFTQRDLLLRPAISFAGQDLENIGGISTEYLVTNIMNRIENINFQNIWFNGEPSNMLKEAEQSYGRKALDGAPVLRIIPNILAEPIVHSLSGFVRLCDYLNAKEERSAKLVEYGIAIAHSRVYRSSPSENFPKTWNISGELNALKAQLLQSKVALTNGAEARARILEDMLAKDARRVIKRMKS